MSGFSFGAPATTSAATGSFSFGSSFGTPAATSAAPGGFSLGSAPTAGGLSFGTPAVNTGLGFGTPATSTGLSFGTPATGASTGLSFGAPAASTGLSFGTPAATNTGLGLSFGAPAASQPSLSFGLGSTTAAPNFAGAFGAPASSATPGFSLGAPATSTATAFGLGSGFGTNPQTSLTGGGGLGATLGSSTPSTLNFGTGGSSLGGGTSFLGLGGVTKPLLGAPSSTSATSTSLGLGGATTPSLGLGGSAPFNSSLGQQGSSTEQNAEKSARESNVPPELMQTVEDFKVFVKQQKSVCSDISRGSIKPINKVESDIESLRQDLLSLRNNLHRHMAVTERLKVDSSKALQYSEMAQQTHETPAGLQMDNTAPDEYFLVATETVEHEIKMFGQEIDTMERQMMHTLDPGALSKQELVTSVRRLHEIFVALASRLQVMHSSVEQQKDTFLALRKQLLQDTTDIFKDLNRSNKDCLTSSKIKIPSGPPLFSGFGRTGPLMFSASASQGLPANSRPTFPAPLSFGLGQSNSFLSNTTLAGAPTDSSDSRPFQLQQPPMGNKRGKR